MKDPFKAHANSERLKFVFVMILLLVPVTALAILLDPTKGGGGDEVQAEVLGFGTRATLRGDQPLLTLRLPNGSIRQIPASRKAVQGCKKGSRISLIQRAGFLGVGIRGCYTHAQT
jgi:hypothetical protein